MNVVLHSPLTAQGGFAMVNTATEKQEIRVCVRHMIRRDMLEIFAIESQSFEFPWSEHDFLNCLSQRNVDAKVAEHNDRVVGFMIYELNKTHIQILNFVVFPRRKGIGSQMMAKLIGKLSSQRRNRITLEVRETNLPAQLFFKAMDFRAVSILRDHYADTQEDAYLMRYRYRP